MKLLLIVLAVIVIAGIILLIRLVHSEGKELIALMEYDKLSDTNTIFCEECGCTEGYSLSDNKFVAECSSCTHLCEKLI